MRNSFLSLILLAGCQVTTTDNFVNPPPGPPDSCTAIASLPGCDQGSISYSCASDRPDDGDANLVCSNGTPGALGAQLYCCAPFAQYDSACAPDPTLAGCGGVAMGFRCTGEGDPPTTPSDADPTIACSAAIADGGANRYCCNTAAPIATCAVDPSMACTGIAVGYSCAGSDAPFPTGFTCTAQPAAAAGQTGYCCMPSPS